jgi:hypothetical protein
VSDWAKFDGENNIIPTHCQRLDGTRPQDELVPAFQAESHFVLLVKIQPALYIDRNTVWFLVVQNSTNPFAGNPTHYHLQADGIG